MDTSVEVVVFSFNHEPFIESSLKSILEQNVNFPVKIRVHDDNSSDLTAVLAERLLSRSGIPYEIHRSAQNKYKDGISFFHHFIANSKSEFVAILDGDDVWTDSNKLQLQLNALRENPQVSLSHHKALQLEGEKRVSIAWPPDWATAELVSGNLLSKNNFVSTSTVVLRVSDFPKEMPEGFNELSIGDYPMWALTSQDKYIHFINKEMSDYRVHSNNLFASLNTDDAMEKELAARIYIANAVKKENKALWQHGILEAAGYLVKEEFLNKIKDKEAEIDTLTALLENVTLELDNLKSSKSWKYTSFMRRIRGLL